MDSRYYPNVEADVSQLTVELRNLFDSEYEVQTFQVSTTSIVQARKSNTLRDNVVAAPEMTKWSASIS